MNKKFYFGLVATAALFASCSSDDLSVNESRQDVLNGDDRAPIQLLIGSPSSTTRGTGTVGSLGTDTKNNVWAGQQFRVYMLDKGTLTVAKDADGNKIYENAKFTAPNELAGVAAGTPAMEVTSSTDGGLVVNSNVSYFPQEGNFDFWAYRTDGAEGNNVPDVSGTSMLLDFTIDGTQDIMVSKAVPNVAENTGTDPGTYGTKKVPESRIFSAYSVRRDVKPLLNFKHLLTRIAFKVKGSKDLCDKSADPANGVDVANDLAVKVTAIKLKSLATGKLHVAYTTAPTDTIEWTAGTEAVLPLKQRGGSWTHAELEWASAAVASGATVTFPSGATTTATDDAVIYTSQAVDDKKGQPLPANATTFAAADQAGTLSSCYFCREKVAPVQGAISVNADLVDLDPVAPIWNTSVGTEGEAYATPVGEALLVAPQQNYELTVETSQKVPETIQTKYCTIGQQIYQKKSTLIAGSLPTITVVAPATTAAGTYEAADADKKFAVSVIGDVQPILDTLTVEGTFYFKIGDNAYREAVVNSTNKAVKAADPSYYYFASAADASAAVAAYIAWYADQGDETKETAKDNAIAKGTTEKGKAVTEVLTYTIKNDSKTITLNGISQTIGSTTTYKPYKANNSYTVTLTLAGMEPITGETGNIGIGGYEVDGGGEIDIDMDEQPSVSSNNTPGNP